MPDSSLLLLAQDITPPTPPGQIPAGGTTGDPGLGPAGGGAAAPGSSMWVMVLIFVGVMFLMMIFTGKKEKRKRETLLNSLKKHDRVRTIGGVIGSVVEVKPDVVVIKVDEASNTRITFDRSAIAVILKEASPTT